MRTRTVLSLIIFALFGALLLLGVCNPAKGQPLPSAVSVPPQEGCSDSVKKAYIEAGFVRAEHEARLWSEGRSYELEYWLLDTLGYFPEGMGGSTNIAQEVSSSVKRWKETLGDSIRIVLLAFTDADRSAPNREQDYSDNAALQFGRWSTYKEELQEWVIGAPLVERVDCRDPFFQGVIIYVFRLSSIKSAEQSVSPHGHDDRYAKLDHKHSFVAQKEAVLRMSWGKEWSYNRVDLPGAHFEMGSEAEVYRLSFGRKLWPLTGINLRLGGEGEWKKGDKGSHVHRTEFDEAEIELCRFLNFGFADISVRDVRMPENAYTHRFEGVGPYVGFRLGKDLDLWNTGQFRAFIGLDARASIGVLWGKAVRPSDLTEQSETAIRANLGIQVRVGVAFFEGGVL